MGLWFSFWVKVTILGYIRLQACPLLCGVPPTIAEIDYLEVNRLYLSFCWFNCRHFPKRMVDISWYRSGKAVRIYVYELWQDQIESLPYITPRVYREPQCTFMYLKSYDLRLHRHSWAVYFQVFHIFTSNKNICLQPSWHKLLSNARLLSTASRRSITNSWSMAMHLLI